MAIRFPALDLGPLPVEVVNRVLRCDLPPGIVHFSAANQDHAFEQHGDDFLSCQPHIEATVLNPDYIGQGPQYVTKGFEMVRDLNQMPRGGNHILVALTLQPDNLGRYLVQSVYQIAYGTVRTRMKRDRLFRVREG